MWPPSPQHSRWKLGERWHFSIYCKYAGMYVRVHAFIYVCMYVCLYVRMPVCMYVCMYVCMHVCTHIYVCSQLARIQRRAGTRPRWHQRRRLQAAQGPRVSEQYGPTHIHVYIYMDIVSPLQKDTSAHSGHRINRYPF